jgi:hypothetical protein
MTPMVRSRSVPLARGRYLAGVLACVVGLTACPPPPAPTPVERGREIFFDETFDGNGRTCGTCHRMEDNFGLTPALIATLPPDDPLFVAETNVDLAHDFENPALMRAFGLILENQDGFADLPNDFNMRGVPHTLALRTSVTSRDGPRTGWAGDGAPGDGSLRSFSTGAVIQHFPLTTNRIPGVDFRLPTDRELDDLEAFMLSLGRQTDLQLPLPLRGIVASRGQDIFMDNTLGKCNACHFNAGANADPNIFGPGAGNLSFNTGVEALPEQPADLAGELNPPDDGFGTPGNGEFNTPPLVEAADTGPFFHNNSVQTIEGAVAFYDEDAFNSSPAGQLLADATGSGIDLEPTQIEAVAAFLRVINALENIRAATAMLETAVTSGSREDYDDLRFAGEEVGDAAMVLAGAGLHPEAVQRLDKAKRLTHRAAAKQSRQAARQAIAELARARDELIESS